MTPEEREENSAFRGLDLNTVIIKDCYGNIFHCGKEEPMSILKVNVDPENRKAYTFSIVGISILVLVTPHAWWVLLLMVAIILLITYVYDPEIKL